MKGSEAMLIKCPECGKEVSDKSKNCIHCGYPLPKTLGDAKASQPRKKMSAELKILLGFLAVIISKQMMLLKKQMKMPDFCLMIKREKGSGAIGRL